MISQISDDSPSGIDATWIASRHGADTTIKLGWYHELPERCRADKNVLSGVCLGIDGLLAYLHGESDNAVKSLSLAVDIADVPVAMLS